MAKLKPREHTGLFRLATFSIPETDIPTDLFSFLLFHCQRFQVLSFRRHTKALCTDWPNIVLFSFKRDPLFLYFQFLDDSFYSVGDRCLIVSDCRQRGRKIGSGNKPWAVLRLQEPSFVENRLPAGLDERVFEKCIEKDNHMAEIVHLDMKALFAGKESLHILDAKHRNAKQMISIGTRHNTCHLFLSEVAAERKRRSIRHLIGTIHDRCRQQLRPVIPSSQLHALLEREVWCGKKGLDKVNTFCQQPFDDVDVHFVTVPTNNTIAVDVPVTVYEVIHIAVVPLAIRNHILEIKFSRFGE